MKNLFTYLLLLPAILLASCTKLSTAHSEHLMIDDIPLGQHINNFYKAFAEEWATQEHNRFNITETFISPWVQAEQLTLPMQVNTLPKIYEGFVAQIGEYRIQAEQGVSLAESVLAMQKREALEKRIAQLEDQLRRECQPRKKIELHQTIMNLKKQL